MATGLNNKLAGQAGEFLACAELGKRGVVATPFAGNVPEFDLVAAGPTLKTITIQVKTTRADNWPSTASSWLNIEVDEEKECQIDHGEKKISNPDLIYVCVALKPSEFLQRDRFFICRKRAIQTAYVRNYREYMKKHDWKRPKNYKSMDNRIYTEDLVEHEDNWSIILDELTI